MNTIEKYTLELIGEDPDNPDVFTDDTDGMKPIRDSINDAIEEINMVTGGQSGTYYMHLRQAKNFYRLDFTAGSFAWVTNAWLVGQRRRINQTDLIRLTHINPRWLMDSGTPQAYFQIGLNHIGVWPAPAADSDILEITAVVIPSRYVSGDDRINLKKQWARAAAHFAAGEYFASRGDAKTAVYHHNSYLKKIGLNVKYPYAKEYVPGFRSGKEYWGKTEGYVR